MVYIPKQDRFQQIFMFCFYIPVSVFCSKLIGCFLPSFMNNANNISSTENENSKETCNFPYEANFSPKFSQAILQYWPWSALCNTAPLSLKIATSFSNDGRFQRLPLPLPLVDLPDRKVQTRWATFFFWRVGREEHPPKPCINHETSYGLHFCLVLWTTPCSEQSLPSF